MLAIVRRNLLVEVEGCKGARRSWASFFKRAIVFGEDCDGGVITINFLIQGFLRKFIAEIWRDMGYDVSALCNIPRGFNG